MSGLRRGNQIFTNFNLTIGMFRKSPMYYLVEDNWYRDFDFIINVLESCQKTNSYSKAIRQLIATHNWGKRTLDEKVHRAAKLSHKSYWEVREQVELFYIQLRTKREIIESRLRGED